MWQVWIYLFQLFSSGISLFTGIKNIQVFCFLMICMIVEFSSEVKQKTVFLDLSRYADPGNFCSGTFSEIITLWKPCFDSSGLLNIPQVVRTCPVVIFVWQVIPSGAVTGNVLAPCVHTLCPFNFGLGTPCAKGFSFFQQLFPTSNQGIC